MFMKKIGCLLIAPPLLTLHVAAQESQTETDSTAQQLKIEQLAPVEVRSVYANYKSPFSTYDFNKADIERRNLGQDIPYLLQHTPSVVISSDAGAGIGYTNISIRGTDSKRINFTINGIPVNDGESQGTFFVNFPDLLSNASNIQIQRGVGTSTNGTGAFGASVNIANLQTEPDAYLNYQVSAGSFNTLRNTLKLGSGKLKNGISAELRLSKINSDGYIERAKSDLKALQSIVSWENKAKTTKLTFNLFTGIQQTGQAWNGIDSAQLATDRRANTLGMKEDGTYYPFQNDNYQQDFYQLFYDQKIKDWSFRTGLFLTRGKGYYDEYRTNQKFSEYGLSNPIIGNDTITRVNLTRQLWLDNYFGGIIFSAFYKKDRNELTIGGSGTYYDNHHFGYVTWAEVGFPNLYKWYDLPASKKDATIYAKYQRLLGNNWYAFGDLQYRFVNYETEGFRRTPNLDVNETYHFFNPKIGISYIKSKGPSLEKSYLSLAVANKEPNRNDFETGLAPKHESLYNLEVGYGKSENKRYHYNANYYLMYYRNQLINDGKINDVGAYTRFNVPESYRMGIELSGGVHISKQWNIWGNLTLSRNKITALEMYYDDYDNGGQIVEYYKNTDIAFSPNIIGAIGIHYSVSNKLSLELLGKYVGRSYMDNTQNKQRSLNPYYIVDFNTYYQVLKNKNWDIDAKFSIMNITNSLYANNGYTFSYLSDQRMITENFYYPQAGINFLIGLQFNLK